MASSEPKAEVSLPATEVDVVVTDGSTLSKFTKPNETDEIIRLLTHPNRRPSYETVLRPYLYKMCRDPKRESVARVLTTWRAERGTPSDDPGWTFLHYAARSGNVAMMKAILKEVKDELGVEEAKQLHNASTIKKKETALHVAARNQEFKACMFLLDECNLRADDKNADGKFPYQLAEESANGKSPVSVVMEWRCKDLLAEAKMRRT